MQTTMIGKSKMEIIALFEKPEEHIYNSNLIILLHFKLLGRMERKI
jgi:hypothetical protein